MKLVAASGAFVALACVVSGLVIPDEQVLQSLSLDNLEDDTPLSSSESFLFDLHSYITSHRPQIGQSFGHDFSATDEVLDETDVDIAADLFQHEESTRLPPDHYEIPSYKSAYEHEHHESYIPETSPSSSDPDTPSTDTPHHHHKPNLTIYELISKSKYTTKFAKLISDFPDLVDLLNGTSANYTLFVPTDKAFDKIHKHHERHGNGKHGHAPPKEYIEAALKYHISESFYPAGRVLASRTIPTLLQSAALGADVPQRISNQIGFKGLSLDFYSRIVAIDIFATNGVIHGIDTILIPPFKVATGISLLPSAFSTLELALRKTGLYEALNDTSTHVGGTFFAPSNGAFARLGPKINAFLFSPPGLKYLKALLKYHIVKNETLYSDILYKSDGTMHPIPKGHFHVDLQTLLPSHHLSIDISRLGRILTMKINGDQVVAVTDGIARDGVIHVTSHVLIPPRHAAAAQRLGDDGLAFEEAEMSVEEFVARMEGSGGSFGRMSLEDEGFRQEKPRFKGWKLWGKGRSEEVVEKVREVVVDATEEMELEL